MTATDKLRCLLNERGVEYFKHEDGEPLRKLEKADEPATSWHMGGASVCAVPIEGSDLLDLWIDHCTPEQAIAATLGKQGYYIDHDDEGTHIMCDRCGEYIGTAEEIAAMLGGGECEIETTESWLPAEQYHRCKHCGAFFAVMNASGDIPPCVCPNCGKAVKR